MPAISVLFRYLPYYMTGIPACNYVTGDILYYNRSRSDHYIASYGNAWIDHNISTDPDIIAYGYRFSIFQIQVTHIFINGMTCCIYA